jgi:hypothetical protein
MFCSHCGAAARDKFCSHCGRALLAIVRPDEPAAPASAIEWQSVVEYETVVSVPAVRDRIARAAAQAKRRMTGEQFLDLCGKPLGSLTGVPLPWSSIAQFARSVYANLGIKTGKSREAAFTLPPGEAMVAVLCWLARTGRTLRAAHQLTDGCLLKASLPSDLFALEGDLLVSVGRAGRGAKVSATIEIEGQAFDWGKSTRCLDELFADLSEHAAA